MPDGDDSFSMPLMWQYALNASTSSSSVMLTCSSLTISSWVPVSLSSFTLAAASCDVVGSVMRAYAMVIFSVLSVLVD
jgi:hypothetical protein